MPEYVANVHISDLAPGDLIDWPETPEVLTWVEAGYISPVEVEKPAKKGGTG